MSSSEALSSIRPVRSCLSCSNSIVVHVESSSCMVVGSSQRVHGGKKTSHGSEGILIFKDIQMSYKGNGFQKEINTGNHPIRFHDDRRKRPAISRIIKTDMISHACSPSEKNTATYKSVSQPGTTSFTLVTQRSYLSPKTSNSNTSLTDQPPAKPPAPPPPPPPPPSPPIAYLEHLLHGHFLHRLVHNVLHLVLELVQVQRQQVGQRGVLVHHELHL